MKLRSLTNTRPSKDVGAELVANAAKGAMKISLAAAKLLGVVEGDYIDVAEHPDKAHAGEFFVGKGFIKTDAEGNKTEQNGSKLARSGSYYNFSSAGTWASLGTEGSNTTYEVTEEQFVDEDNPEEETGYFKLGESSSEVHESPSRETKPETKEETPSPVEDVDSPVEAVDFEENQEEATGAPDLNEL